MHDVLLVFSVYFTIWSRKPTIKVIKIKKICVFFFMEYIEPINLQHHVCSDKLID